MFKRTGENGELLFNVNRVSARNGEKVLEVDSGDGYTTLRMYLVLLNYTPKNG